MIRIDVCTCFDLKIIDRFMNLCLSTDGFEKSNLAQKSKSIFYKYVNELESIVVLIIDEVIEVEISLL